MTQFFHAAYFSIKDRSLTELIKGLLRPAFAFSQNSKRVCENISNRSGFAVPALHFDLMRQLNTQ